MTITTGPQTTTIDDVLQKAFPDAEILTFADGDAALDWLDRESPDLLISDLVHPGMSGLEMLSRLCRKDVAYPIVMVSGMMSQLEQDARRKVGPRLNVHYLPKPFFMNQFIFFLKQCLALPLLEAGLRKWSAGRPQPLRIVQLDDEELILGLVAHRSAGVSSRCGCTSFSTALAWKILSEARPDLLITMTSCAVTRNGMGKASCVAWWKEGLNNHLPQQH